MSRAACQLSAARVTVALRPAAACAHYSFTARFRLFTFKASPSEPFIGSVASVAAKQQAARSAGLVVSSVGTRHFNLHCVSGEPRPAQSSIAALDTLSTSRPDLRRLCTRARAPMDKVGVCLLLLLSASSLLGHVRAAQPGEADIDAEVVVENEADEQPPVATYNSPRPIAPVLLAENFDDKEHFDKNWIQSLAKKEDIDEDIAKYDGNF